jgi:hypothetical protein
MTTSPDSTVKYAGRIVSCTHVQYYPIRRAVEVQYGLQKTSNWAPYGLRVALEKFCPEGSEEWFPCSEKDSGRIYDNLLVEIILPVRREGDWLTLLVQDLQPHAIDIRSQQCRIILQAPNEEPVPQKRSESDEYRRFCGRIQHDLAQPYKVTEITVANYLDLEAERLYREHENLDVVTSRLIKESL